jgi:hypothetical protein
MSLQIFFSEDFLTLLNIYFFKQKRAYESIEGEMKGKERGEQKAEG